MFALIVRHRLRFLTGVLVTAVVLALLGQTDISVVSEAAPLLLYLLALALVVCGLAALNARRPETFVVRAGTFTTPPDANAVLSVGTSSVWPVIMTRAAVHILWHGSGIDRFLIGVAAFSALLVPALWYSVLGPFGLFLRPDGVLDRQLSGSLFVPWEAGPTAEPATTGVRIRIARPELAVRRGFRPGTTVRTGADPGFTAWAINRYAAAPQDRPAIGTTEELLRLRPR